MPPDRPGDAGPEATPGGPRSRPAPRPSGARSAGGPKRPPRPDPDGSTSSGNGAGGRARTTTSPTKQAPAKKTAARKAPAKKTSAKKTASKKPSAKKTPTSGAGRRTRGDRSDPVTRSTGPLAGDRTVISGVTDDVVGAAAPVDFAPVPAPQVTRTAETPVVRVPAPAAEVAAPAVRPGPAPTRPGVRHGRRVKRVVRRIELWSVLKLCLVLYTCLYVAMLATLAVVWGIAYSSGQIENLQEFLGQVGLDNYRFYGDQMFRAAAAIGAIAVLAGTILTVLTAALVNLISEMTGGIRVVVIEEDVDPGRRTR